jgi:hypothetical protein
MGSSSNTTQFLQGAITPITGTETGANECTPIGSKKVYLLG